MNSPKYIPVTDPITAGRIEAAIAHLSATWDPEEGEHYYYDHAMQRYYLVDDSDLARLGEMLEAGGRDVYSSWCSEVGGADGYTWEQARAKGWR